MVLDISAVLRTGDRLTPDTPGCIFIATSLVSLPGTSESQLGAGGCLAQIGSSAVAMAHCPPPSAAMSARLLVICERPCVFKSAGRGPKLEKRTNKIQN